MARGLYHILFLGENWFGSCARACCYALRRLNHEVADVDVQTFIPTGDTFVARGLHRLVYPIYVSAYNRAVLKLAYSIRPDMLIAYKAPHITARTLQKLRMSGVRLYNFYPDTSVFTHGSLLPKALVEYDCVFYTKPFVDEDIRRRLKIRASCFVPHGYDPEVHRRYDLTCNEATRYGADVVVLATHTHHKQLILEELVRSGALAGRSFKIWGNQWHTHGKSAVLEPYVQGVALNGAAYSKAIQASKVNVALTSGVVAGASQGDNTTTRTYEIPACGGFMLHERSDELTKLFKEGIEVACYQGTTELVSKVKHYLDRKSERAVIADAAYRRAVPRYSYDERMQLLLDWHAANGADGK